MLGLLLIVPLTIIGIPLRIAVFITKMIDPDTDAPKVKDNGYFSAYFFMAIFTAAGFLCLYSMFAMWFYTWHANKPNLFQTCGVIGYVIAALLCGFYIHSWWSERRAERRMAKWEQRAKNYGPYVEKKKKPNVFWEGIKAWYKKNCPLIDWK